MRIESVSIRNYKGIKAFQLENLSDKSTIMISGRNGTGKSLVLEAIVDGWHGNTSLHDRVGPFGDELSVEINISFTDAEAGQIRDSIRSAYGYDVDDASSCRLQRTASRLEERYPDTSVVTDTVRNKAFRSAHPFANIDYLPASRNAPAYGANNVDLSMFYKERIEEERDQYIQQVVQYRNPISLPDVGSYLLTLDYQKFVAQRQFIEVQDEYALLADTFKAATGKTLRLPEYDLDQGSSRIRVELPTGQCHALEQLSAGELEMLGLMYYTRRVSAAGGVLLIDEPEQHLHPTLQAAIFDAVHGLSDRAQVMVVSHSVNLISVAPSNSLYQVSAPSLAQENQALEIGTAPARAQLVAELGVSPANLMQNDVVLAVEGVSDERILKALFPVELGRALILSPGDRASVLQRYDSLNDYSGGIGWLCVVDRDLFSDEEIAQQKTSRPKLFVWPRRAIESVLISPTLIAALYNQRKIDERVTASDISAILAEEAEPLKSEVLANLVTRQLMREHPAPTQTQGLGRFEQMRRYQQDYAIVSQNRADSVEAVRSTEESALGARWTEDWWGLVDPKALLGRVASRLGLGSRDALFEALVAHVRDNPEKRPQGLDQFKDRLDSALAGADRT